MDSPACPLCDDPEVYARGLCRRCYAWAANHGHLDRFERLDKSECRRLRESGQIAAAKEKVKRLGLGRHQPGATVSAGGGR